MDAVFIVTDFAERILGVWPTPEAARDYCRRLTGDGFAIHQHRLNTADDGEYVPLYEVDADDVPAPEQR